MKLNKIPVKFMPKTMQSKKKHMLATEKTWDDKEPEREVTKPKPLLDDDEDILEKDVVPAVDPDTEAAEEEESEDTLALDTEEIDPFGDKWEQ